MNAFTSGRRNGKPAPASTAHPQVPRWKRILDRVLIVLALPFVAPVMLFLAALIKLVSPGPVFFRQERLGLGRKPFVCVKFRSMHVNADDRVHREHMRVLRAKGCAQKKLDAGRDPRLIRWGPLLRATGLDELPQLLNVWRGEMSWVGPRPCIPYELELYSAAQRERFNALPGLTGLWQVKGKNRTSFDQMVDLDIDYVRRQSLLLDFSIVLRTPFVMLGQLLDGLKGQRDGVSGDSKEKGVGETQSSMPAVSDAVVSPLLSPRTYESTH